MYAIRPPEYFPGLPFWALMLNCDRFILADTFEYSRQSFQNRARLRNPNGWQWITVPLKRGRHNQEIRYVEIDNTVPWRGKHFRAMSFNYRSTPYFEFYESKVSGLFERRWEHLGALTVASIRLVAEVLSLTPPEVLSTVTDDPRSSDDTELLLETDPASLSGTRMQFTAPEYDQNFGGFESGMSILDLLFNYGPDTRSIVERGIVDLVEDRNNGIDT